MFQDIIVSLDEPEEAAEALGPASCFARRVSAPIRIVAFHPYDADPTELERTVLEKSEATGEITRVVEVIPIAGDLRRLEDRHGPAMIVMATHHRAVGRDRSRSLRRQRAASAGQLRAGPGPNPAGGIGPADRQRRGRASGRPLDGIERSGGGGLRALLRRHGHPRSNRGGPACGAKRDGPGGPPCALPGAGDPDRRLTSTTRTISPPDGGAGSAGRTRNGSRSTPARAHRRC